jgi:hypothetical protein
MTNDDPPQPPQPEPISPDDLAQLMGPWLHVTNPWERR